MARLSKEFFEIVEREEECRGHKKNAKILFILKKRQQTYDEGANLASDPDKKNNPYYNGISTGLKNSVKFVVKMLNDAGIEAAMEIAIDNNCIDRLVKNYKPTHVVIEAFWVVPSKFDVLSKLHPTVKWIVRNHSELPFLSTEGSATGWMLEYVSKRNVFMAVNSPKSYTDVLDMFTAVYGEDRAREKLLYLPNYYINKVGFVERKDIDYTVDVGCFGAFRPYKNQMVQAVAAVEFARQRGVRLRYHVNTARIEGDANPILKSVRAYFNSLDNNMYKLVEHGWLEHEDFLQLITKMDIGLQISFSETFNIVAADFVACGVPMVVSEEIFWMPEQFMAKTTDVKNIVHVMNKTLSCFHFWRKGKKALRALEHYNEESRDVWLRQFEGLYN